MKAQEDGRMGGWKEGRKVDGGRVGRWMGGWKEGWMGGRVGRSMEGRMGGRVEGRRVDEPDHHRGACRALRSLGRRLTSLGVRDAFTVALASQLALTFSSSCELVPLHAFGGWRPSKRKGRKGDSGAGPRGGAV